jgi:hypothetical protein
VVEQPLKKKREKKMSSKKKKVFGSNLISRSRSLRKSAEGLLQASPPNTFILRPSSNANCFALSHKIGALCSLLPLSLASR